MSGNAHKIILDLCAGTDAWSHPYKEAGYDVRLITFPDYDVCTYMPPNNVYGILAAPPCTEFSLAKGSRPRDFNSSMDIVRACLNIIWSCRLEGSLKFWVLENPRGMLRQFLGLPAMTFEQWQFGDDGIKPTDLWGYFKKPTVVVKTRPGSLFQRRIKTTLKQGSWDDLFIPDWCKDMNLKRADVRAITPPGFAQAFYKANR